MRFGGFCEVVTAWKEMGLMNDTPDESLAKGSKEMTWVELTAKLIGSKADEESVDNLFCETSADSQLHPREALYSPFIP